MKFLNVLLLILFGLIFFGCSVTSPCDNKSKVSSVDEYTMLIEIDWYTQDYGEYSQYPLYLAVIKGNISSDQHDSLGHEDVFKYVELTRKNVGIKDTLEVDVEFESNRAWYLFYIFYDENLNSQLDTSERHAGWYSGWLFAEDRKEVYSISSLGL